MKKSYLSLLCVLVTLQGCDWNKSDEPDVVDTDKKSDRQGQNTDTDTVNHNGSDSDTSTSDTSILDEVVDSRISKFEELALALEAKRLELDQKKRDLISREQLLSGLEADVLNKQDKLEDLHEKLVSARKVAVDRVKTQTREQEDAIHKKYKKEHEVLEKRWSEIQEEQKEFIKYYFGTKELLKPKIEKLKKERQERVKTLTATMEGMKPTSSALMLTSMTREDAIAVMRGLSPAMSAEIFASMPPKTAATLAEGMLGPRVKAVRESTDLTLPEAPEEISDNDKDTSIEKSDSVEQPTKEK